MKKLLLLFLLVTLLGCTNKDATYVYRETDASAVVHYEFNEKVKISNLTFVLKSVEKINDDKYFLDTDMDKENFSLLNNKYTLCLAIDDEVYKLSSHKIEKSEDGKYELYIISDNFKGVPTQIVVVDNQTLKIKGAINIFLNN